MARLKAGPVLRAWWFWWVLQVGAGLAAGWTGPFDSEIQCLNIAGVWQAVPGYTVAGCYDDTLFYYEGR
jgi:hypothetical protein